MVVGDNVPCRICGMVPTQRLPIRRHVGMIFLQQFFKVEQPLCRVHGTELTKQWLRKTVLMGWWGVVSFFVNCFVVVRDITVLAQYKQLPEPVLSRAGTVSEQARVARTAEATLASASAAAPGSWGPDPYRRHAFRWFNGSLWTDQVSDGETVSTDPIGWR